MEGKAIPEKNRNPRPSRVRKPKGERKTAQVFLNSASNPFKGKTPEVIVNTPDYSKELAKVMADFRKEVQGDPTLKIYQAATAKLKKVYQERHPDFPVLSLSKFAQVVAVDDLSSLVNGIGAAYSLYQKPSVKEFVDRLISKGFKSVSSVFTSGPKMGDSRDLRSPVSDYGFDNVDLEHVFCTFSDTVPVTSDPADIPKVVYSSRFEGEYTFTVNTNGDGALLLQGQGFWLNGTAQTTPWIATNTASTYDPNSTLITGTWVYAQAGPLFSSLNLMSQVKLIGLTVDVRPFTSANKTQGGYAAGILVDQLTTNNNTMTQNALNFQYMSALPFFEVCDMKTSTRFASFPSRDPSLAEWWPSSGIPLVGTVRPDYGCFLLVVSGAEPSTTISLRYSLSYSLVPSKDGLLLIRGAVPRMAPYTNIFLEFLRSKYPSIVNWPKAKCVELYKHFKDMNTTSYRKLIENVSYEYEHRMSDHTMPMPSAMGGSEIMME